MATQLDPQLALDETHIEDPFLEQALEARQRVKDELAGVRGEFKTASDKANTEIEKLELPEGRAVRVGRFRISRTILKARVVSFETEERTRVQIALVEDD